MPDTPQPDAPPSSRLVDRLVRGLGILVVVVILAEAGGLRRRAVNSYYARHEAEAVALVQRLGGQVNAPDGRAVAVQLHGTAVRDQDLAVLETLERLYHLDLGNTDVSDVGLAHLARVSTLASVNLVGTRVTFEGVAVLSGLLPDLAVHVAELPANPAEREAIAAIRAVGGSVLFGKTGARSVDLANRQIADDDLRHLSGFANLRYLSLRDTPVTDDCAPNLQGLHALEELWLFGTQVGDGGMSYIGDLTNIRRLSLSGQVSTTGLAELVGLERLEQLWLTGVADAGLVHVGTLQSLEGLTVTGPVTDDGLASLAGLDQLETLGLGNTGVEGPGLRHLSDLAELRALRLGRSPVHGEGLAHLPRGLQLLGLNGTRVTDDDLRNLSGMSELRFLDLRSTRVTGPGLVHLQQLPALHQLDLRDTAITGDGLARLAGVPSLRSLQLEPGRVAVDDVVSLQAARPDLGIEPRQHWIRSGLIGRPAPDFTLSRMGGGEVRLSDHRGEEIVILEFWASWCAPCVRILPSVTRIVSGYRDRGVVLYGVTYSEGERVGEGLRPFPDDEALETHIRGFLEQNDLELDVLLDRNAGLTIDDGSLYMGVGGRYGVKGVPQTVIIDRRGVVRAVYPGASPDIGRRLAIDLERLLAADADEG